MSTAADVIDYNPSGIAPEDELPLATPPDQDLWAENFCYQAWDRTQDLGVWLHLARMPYDLSIWRETVIVFLPGDRYFLSRAFARGAHEAGPGSAGSRLTCVEPFRRFRYEFDGVGRYVDQATVGDQALPDGPAAPARFALTFDAAAPMWDMSRELKGDTHFATMHHEQPCRISGTFDGAGETLTMDGGGIRDHSRGPRDFSKLRSHVWLNAVFPSGACFNVLANREHTTGRQLAIGFVSDGRTFHDFAIQPSYLEDPDSPFAVAPVAMNGGGEYSEIEVEILRVLPMAMAQPNDLVLGKAQLPGGQGNRLYEGRARYTWRGETAYGHIERSCPLTIPPAPGT